MVKILLLICWLKPQEWPCHEHGLCHEARYKQRVKVPSLLQPTAWHHSANISVMLVYCFTFCRHSMNNAFLIKKTSTLSSLGFLACVPFLLLEPQKFYSACFDISLMDCTESNMILHLWYLYLQKLFPLTNCW